MHFREDANDFVVDVSRRDAEAREKARHERRMLSVKSLGHGAVESRPRKRIFGNLILVHRTPQLARSHRGES